MSGLDVPDPYPGWLDAWWREAEASGTSVSDVDGRIARLLELWKTQIGNAWWRAGDRRLLGCRYRRGDANSPRAGEHRIEAEVLCDPLAGLRYFAGEIVDGVNAVPLARDTRGGRSNNVEADLFLLVAPPVGDPHVVIAEVKAESNHAWYAVVENLLQLRLAHENPEVATVFDRRREALALTHEMNPRALRGLVLAPQPFYASRSKRESQKGNAVPPARRLCAAFAEQLGVTVELGVWDAPTRTISLLRQDEPAPTSRA